jgi:hypothetical protein
VTIRLLVICQILGHFFRFTKEDETARSSLPLIFGPRGLEL